MSPDTRPDTYYPERLSDNIPDTAILFGTIVSDTPTYFEEVLHYSHNFWSGLPETDYIVTTVLCPWSDPAAAIPHCQTPLLPYLYIPLQSVGAVHTEPLPRNLFPHGAEFPFPQTIAWFPQTVKWSFFSAFYRKPRTTPDKEKPHKLHFSDTVLPRSGCTIMLRFSLSSEKIPPYSHTIHTTGEMQ